MKLYVHISKPNLNGQGEEVIRYLGPLDLPEGASYDDEVYAAREKYGAKAYSTLKKDPNAQLRVYLGARYDRGAIAIPRRP
ncbi:hypothetical protein [Sulfitobacter sp. R18_1]|uniref:hypothetical protein n=1 Tax=Sulfitobacter sp. R18_1 TaxID=2821104 RepID=UPI001ADA46E9|nr:hypothetical protein [Sulfitobacter sp. R18_1]MBO9428225.1 hypothetical protein [Sulfitobacter sp. R18_1]